MNWSPTNFEESLLPLTIMSCALGLRAIEYPRGRLRRLISFLHLSVLMSILGWSVLYKSRKMLKYNLRALASSLYAYSAAIHTVSDVLMSLSSLYFTKSFKLFVRNIVKIDETLKMLGTPVNHRKDLYCYYGLLLMVLICAIVMGLVDVISMIPYLSVWMTVYLAGSSVLWMLNTTFLILEFCVSVRSICVRFEKINKALCSLASTMADSRNQKTCSHSIDQLNAWYFFVSRRPRRDNNKIMQTIHAVKQVHLQLVRESQILCKIYALQITLAITLCILFTTTILYNLYTMTIDKYNLTIFSTPILVWGSAFFCAMFITRVFVVNTYCENVVYEANKTKGLVHALHGSCTDVELRNEVLQFALQVSLRPIEFSMYGLTLNYSFIRSFFGYVSTYLLIIIQLGGSYDN